MIIANIKLADYSQKKKLRGKQMIYLFTTGRLEGKRPLGSTWVNRGHFIENRFHFRTFWRSLDSLDPGKKIPLQISFTQNIWKATIFPLIYHIISFLRNFRLEITQKRCVNDSLFLSGQTKALWLTERNKNHNKKKARALRKWLFFYIYSSGSLFSCVFLR